MQVILGSGGAIGTELARALPQYTSDIRLVSRNPKKVNDTDELLPGDLTNAASVRTEAVEGSDVAYLTVGLPYDTNIWRSTWAPNNGQRHQGVSRARNQAGLLRQRVYVRPAARIAHD